MNRLAFCLAGIITGLLPGSLAQATDFGPLMNVVHETWPEKTRICVVANYATSRAEVLDLAACAGAASTITVVNVTRPDQLDRATSLALFGVKHDFIVLLPGDPIVRDGSPYATRMVSRAQLAGVPAIATTGQALLQGALFAIGQGTGNALLVNDRSFPTIGVQLPQRNRPVPVARLDRGTASISILAAF